MATDNANRQAHRGWVKWLLSVLAATLYLVIAGIIQNRADGGFVWVWEGLSKPQDVRPWLVGFVVILLLLFAAAMLVKSRHDQQIELLEKQRESAIGQGKKDRLENETYKRQSTLNASEIRGLKERNQSLTERTQSTAAQSVKQQKLVSDITREILAVRQDNARLLAENIKLTEEISLQKNALRRMSHLAAMDLTLLNFVTTVVGCREEDRDSQMRSLLVKFLKDTTQVFDDVCRLWVLRPDKKREYLECWASHNMPEDRAKEHRFYIGNDHKEAPGVAGSTYKTRNLEVVHLRDRLKRVAVAG